MTNLRKYGSIITVRDKVIRFEKEKSMKPRTSLTLLNDGSIRCYSGTINWFVQDICDFIIPILGDTITAEFNGRKITVYKYDNVETLLDRYKNAWY